MSKNINKSINTTLLEYSKTVALFVLIATIAGAYIGIQYQKAQAVTVQNSVIVQSTDAKK